MRFNVQFCVFLGLITALSACSKDKTQTIQVEPLSSTQKVMLRSRLEHGLPVSPTVLDQGLRADDSSEGADECATFKKSLPADYMQGSIEVPEDWDHPEATKIQVFYYGAKITPGNGKIPVVFFNGGPGGSSHSSYEPLETGDAVARGQKISIVFIDQRGTGCSTPYPVTANAATAQRLTHYSSRSIVKDAEAVREKLLGSDGKWKIFGQSFGGYIVHRYLEVAPDHVIGAYAHGSSIPNDWIDWLTARIESQSRVSKTFFDTYPGDEKVLQTARKLVPESRCFTDGQAKLCGPAVLDAATGLLGFHDSWDDLHKWINVLVNNQDPAHPKLVEARFQQWVKNFTFGIFDDNPFGSGVISAMDMSPPGNPTSQKQCDDVYSRLEAKGEKPLDWTINECRLLAGMTTIFDKYIYGITETDPFRIADIEAALSANPQLPFFLYSGQQDVFVPVATFQPEVSALGNRIQYTNFPNTGHDGFFTEAKVWSDLSN